MLSYVALMVFLFYKIQLWDVSLAKDTIYWAVGTAFVLLINLNDALRDERYFRKILVDNLKFILVLEFIVGFYAFNLLIEIILVPLVVLIFAISAVAGMKNEHISVKRIMDSILAFFSFLLIVFALFSVFTNYQELITTDTFYSFLLPPLLTFAYLPFLYFFALIMAYENLFVRLDIFLKDDRMLAKYAKRKIISLCLFSLRKLNRFAKEDVQKFLRLDNKNDVLTMIQDF